MYCRECGRNIEDESLFCVICGARQNAPDTATEHSTHEEAVTIPTQENSPPASPCCAFCGAPIEADAIFCILCGKRQPKPQQTKPFVPAEDAMEKTMLWTHEDKPNEQKPETVVAEASCPAESVQPQPAPKSSVPERLYCIQCGAQLRDNALFCVKCGTRQDATFTPMTNTPIYQEELPRKKRGKGILIFLGVLIIVALLCALLLPKISEALEDDPEEVIDVVSGEAITENETLAPVQDEPVATPAPVQTKSPDTHSGYAASTTTTTDSYNMEYLSFLSDEKYGIFSPDMQQQLTIGGGTSSGLYMSPAQESSSQLFSMFPGDLPSYDNIMYKISGVSGPLQIASSDSSRLLSSNSAVSVDAEWWFPSFDNSMCHIHLGQNIDYALTRKGSEVTLDICDPNNPSQYWVVVRCDDNGTQPSYSTTDSLEQFILSLAERTITINDLMGMDKETVGYVRNGIYAMAGKIFKTQKYQDYFSSTSWYTPYSQDNDLVTARFNQCMSHNLNVCIEYEELMGWR